MYLMGTSTKPVKYDDLLSQVEVIIEMHTFSFPHPTLAPTKAALTYVHKLYLKESKNWGYLNYFELYFQLGMRSS